MLAALLWLLGALVVLIVVLAATPVTCEFGLARDPELRFRVLLRFLGGRTPAIPLRRGSARKRPQKPPRRPEDGKSKRRRGRDRVSVRSIVELVSEVLARIRVRRLSVDGTFGTGDPAETGQIYGALTPAIYAAGAFPRAEIALRPDFERACLRGAVAAELDVVPFALVPPLARFGWRMVRA
ncbi:MAG: DUF2953 domain-containing protein [Paracoccaceae bacterium]|nr:DUF2953 domain-containing protein [Paracoccaceae bacterium]